MEWLPVKLNFFRCTVTLALSFVLLNRQITFLILPSVLIFLPDLYTGFNYVCPMAYSIDLTVAVVFLRFNAVTFLTIIAGTLPLSGTVT